MATKADFIEYVREQLASAGAVSYRRMFGEYAVYLDGKVVGLVCDNQLFVKPTAGGRALLGSVTEAPPFPGATPWFLVDEALESPQEVVQLVRVTACELPLPKPKGAPKAKVRTKAKAKARPKPKPKPKTPPRARRPPAKRPGRR
jgi:TfoX/Sxy family transcriptional regulator of competence genes